MITENLSTLKIHKLTQEQYDREANAGNIDENALYLTPDEEIDLSQYATTEQLNGMATEEYVDNAIASEKAERETEIAVERARINTFTALEDGSTTGDAELQDIRVGYDGTTYETAGEAVRAQIGKIYDEKGTVTIDLNDYFLVVADVSVNGSCILDGHSRVTNQELIPVKEGDKITVCNGYTFNVFKFDKKGSYIGCGTYGYTEYVVDWDGYLRIAIGMTNNVELADFSPAVGTVATADGSYANIINGVTYTNRVVNQDLISVVSGDKIIISNGYAFNVFKFDENGNYIGRGTYGYTEYVVDWDGYVRLAIGSTEHANMTDYVEDVCANIHIDFTVDMTDYLDEVCNSTSISFEFDVNAELIDIRVGYNGKVYNTAGEAVREQIVYVMDSLCPDFNESGSLVAGYPLEVVSTINAKDDGSEWDSITLTHSGKNLFDFKQPVSLVSYAGVSGAGTRYGYALRLPGGTYTIHAEAVGTVQEMYIYCVVNDKDGVLIPQSGDIYLKQGKKYGTRTFTLNDGDVLYVYNGQATTSPNGTEEKSNELLTIDHNIQIEVGSIATAYEPYRGHTFTADISKCPVVEGSYNWTTGVLINDSGEMWQHDPKSGTFANVGSVGDIYTTHTVRNIRALQGINILYSDCGNTKVAGRTNLQNDNIKVKDYAFTIGSVDLNTGTYLSGYTNRAVNKTPIPVKEGDKITISNGYAFNVFKFDENGNYIGCGTYGYTEYVVDWDGYLRLSIGSDIHEDMTYYVNQACGNVIISSKSFEEEVATLTQVQKENKRRKYLFNFPYNLNHLYTCNYEDMENLKDYKPTEFHAKMNTLCSNSNGYLTRTKLGEDAWGNDLYKYVFEPNVPYINCSRNESAGRSFDGVKIDTPTIIILSGIHGLEASNDYAVYNFLKNLLTNRNEALNFIFRNLRLVFVPAICASGLSKEGEGQYRNDNNINLNRAFPLTDSGEPYVTVEGTNTVYDPSGTLYADEVKCVMNVIDEYKDAIALVDMHTHKTYDVMSWNYTNDEVFKYVATRVTNDLTNDWLDRYPDVEFDTVNGAHEPATKVWVYHSANVAGTSSTYASNVWGIPAGTIEARRMMPITNIHHGIDAVAFSYDMLVNFIISFCRTIA